jgi:subfamily B ATP-binding cassette protein MsbA
MKKPDRRAPLSLHPPSDPARGRDPAEGSSSALIGRLWRGWIVPYWPRLVLIFIFMLGVSGATAAYPLLIDWTYRLFEARDMRVITLVPIVVIAVTGIKGIFLYVQSVETSSFVLRIIADMQKAMFVHLIGADLARLQREPTGALISRFTNDVNALRDALTRAITGMARDVFTLIGLIATMFYLDWLLSLIVICVLPLGSLPVARIGKRLRSVTGSAQAHMGVLTSLLNESLSGARMVKTYRLESYERARANTTFEKMYGWFMRLARGRARVEPILEALGGLAVAGVIAFAGWRMVSGSGSVGEFTGFVSALLIAAQPLRALGQLNVALQEGLATLVRIFTLLDEAPRITDRPGAQALNVTGGEIIFDTLRFAYEGHDKNSDGESGAHTPALNDISLMVPAGKLVALVGPSGAGKSTVMNLIPRLYEAQSGRILIDGQDIREVTLASLRGALSLVAQDTVLFNDSVAANIAFGRLEASRHDIELAAHAAAAHDFISALPNGYDTQVGDRGLKLSGGERQRVALARAMLRDAPILLLDEATSALDAESERQVQAALATLMVGRTSLVIAHRLATVRNADHIYVMESGRIAEQGTHDELLARGGLYARLCRLQFFGERETADGPTHGITSPIDWSTD